MAVTEPRHNGAGRGPGRLAGRVALVTAKLVGVGRLWKSPNRVRETRGRHVQRPAVVAMTPMITAAA